MSNLLGLLGDKSNSESTSRVSAFGSKVKSAAIALAILIGASSAPYGWILLSRNPLDTPIAAAPWPVACSTRGCVTSRAWSRHHELRRTFALAAELPEPAPRESLTTLIRQHLVHFGQLKSSVTPGDATRYREEILNISTDEQLANSTGLNIKQYDQLVIMPFLEAEAIRQQFRAETPDDLYRQLAQDRFIVVLPWHFRWNKDQAIVE